MSNIIVDDIGAVVAAMRDPDAEKPDQPYYMYGHRQEIANRLLEMDQDNVYKYKKYPLIALRLDVPEQHKGGLIDYSLNIAILDFTEKEWNSEQRYENVIKPILIPLYKRFLVELKQSGLFIINEEEPEHTKIDRPFWGTTQPEGNVKYIFNDPLDCVEIIGLKLKQRIKTC